MEARELDVVLVGAGQAGLAMSSLLAQAGRDHIVLERNSTLGGSWPDRWDGFRLVTPNWTASLPGRTYDGPGPDGFMTRDEIAAWVRGYATAIAAPVITDAGVRRLSARDGRFALDTTAGPFTAAQVIVATGGYQRPRVPALGAVLSRRVVQLHSHGYRNERSLPPGGVLVVGSGQSGVQIAEELAEAGREVFLSVGAAGWLPRRYRGRDIFRWLFEIAVHGEPHGVRLPSVDQLPDPRLRFLGSPQLTGHDGGRDVDLRRMAASGVTLLGRIVDADGEHVRFADDLGASLSRTEAFFDAQVRPMVEAYIERAAIAADADDRHGPLAYSPPRSPDCLDLRDRGIGSVLWATGYRPDYDWIDLPIFDEDGFPRHHRGVADISGLYFLGMHWQHTLASATLLGPWLDAPHLIGLITH